MTGRYRLIVETLRLRYDITLKRKYTLLRGDSGTGKSELCTIIDRADKEVKISCDGLPVHILGGHSFRGVCLPNCLYIVDEETINAWGIDDFMEIVKCTDSYFLIISRRNFTRLPISVSEIYYLDMKQYDRVGKLVTENRLKNRFLNIQRDSFRPDLIITEDSNSGYYFFSGITKGWCECITANGRTNILDKLIENDGKYDKICVIVDGAAFGDCVEAIIHYISTHRGSDIYIMVPESFEALLLGINALGVDARILEETWDVCDIGFLSGEFNKDFSTYHTESWERFYNAYLPNLTSGDKETEYSKTSDLKPFYYINRQEILKQLPEVVWG